MSSGASPSKTNQKGHSRGSKRTLMIRRDPAGYGLTLSGDQPVFVQTVRPGGAADRAGVIESDIIIKVNGQSVTDASHSEVVDLIQAGPQVALTVIHSSNASAANASSNPLPILGRPGLPQFCTSSLSLNSTMKSAAAKERITPPQPANQDAVRAITDEKLHTMQLMVEQEQRNVDLLRQKSAAQPQCAKLQQDLDQAIKRLAKMEDQLEAFKAGKSIGRPTSVILMPNTSAPIPPPRPDAKASSPVSSSLPSVSLLSSISPPPLPARNKTSSASLTSAAASESATPPPLPPPRQGPPLPPSHASEKRLSHIDKHPKRSKTTGIVASPPFDGPKHERTRSSPSSLVDFSSPGRISPRYETPPGTPPPPYSGNLSWTEQTTPDNLLTWSNLTSGGDGGGDSGIINMEDVDDEFSDQEVGNVTGAIGGLASGLLFGSLLGSDADSLKTPFDDLRDLFCHQAHLAVFLNYVVSNSDPSSLFFYLITETYKLGTLKEMQRWAYEIHSSFLVPGSPLPVPNLEQNIIFEIDRALQNDFDKETVLRKLFWKARAKARRELKDQLVEFREKRSAGLGSIFGPPDSELQQCVESRSKELQVIDELLLPVLDSLSEDLENATDRSFTIASSLATVLAKTFNTRSQSSALLVEKCPTFVSKERKSRIFSRNRKTIQIHGHQFELKHYYHVTYCNHSHKMIWGIGPQGYRCSYCGFDVHKKHVFQVEENCVGPSLANKKSDRKSRGVLDRFFSDIDISHKKTSQTGGRDLAISRFMPDLEAFASLQDDMAAKDNQATDSHNSRLGLRSSTADTTDQATSSELPHGSLGSMAHKSTAAGEESKKRPDSSDRGQDEHLRDGAGVLPSSDLTKTGSKVDRSQSCKLDKKDPKRGNTRDRRKHSDPSIPRSTNTTDVDLEVQPSITNHHSGSSSTSSLSARSSLDSPAGAGSLQEVTQSSRLLTNVFSSSASSGSTVTLTSTSSALAPQISTSNLAEVQTHFQTPTTYEDSDFETEPDPPDWRVSMTQEDLAKLPSKEQKRQDVINEFFHTERSHVRNLKVLDRIFYRPLLESSHMPKDFVERLFPNLEDVLAVHNKYNQKMKERIKAGFPVGSVGDILIEMFEGANGDTLIRVGSEFTKNQKFSIEELKERRRRDHKLHTILTEQERRPECRRLQLPSILPVEHQRLVKYPLLLEQLLKQCDPDEEEYSIVKKCVDRSREILESIDKLVAEAQNIQRLVEIQKCLDTTGLDKMPDNPICAEYRNLDLTKRRLIYDGPLTLKLGDTKRFKTVDLHVLLLEDCIMLLQKQDDKYLLKFHTCAGGTGAVTGPGNAGKFSHSPVIKFSNMLVRPVATDKRAIYLLNTTHGPHIYELVASSTADRTQWFKHISEASSSYKNRENRAGYRGGVDSAPFNGVDADRSKLESADDLSAESRKGLPASRSQSFHEQSSSSRDHRHERQPSSPPEDTGEPDTFAKKSGGEEAGGTGASGQRKRLQRVEILKIAEPCPLIDPSQVVVTQGEILVADPVLTPIEKLRRKDVEVTKALEEKQRLIADMLHIPLEDFDHIVDLASQPSPEKDAREVLLAALAQTKSLSDLVNESLNLSEADAVAAEASRLSAPNSESSSTSSSPFFKKAASIRLPAPPAFKLIEITSSMNHHLTSLLAIIQDRDEERDRLRRELQRSQEQVHALLSQSSLRTSSLSATSPASRPASYISIEENSTAEMSERNPESEDDAGTKVEDASMSTFLASSQPDSGSQDSSLTVDCSPDAVAASSEAVQSPEEHKETKD